jgi:ribose transport system permease protein
VTLPEPSATARQPAPAAAPLSTLSKLVVAAWMCACIAFPLAVFVPEGERPVSLMASVAVLAAVAIAVGIAYARRVPMAWRLMQACLVAVIFAAALWGDRWLFVGGSALFIGLYFLLYTRTVRGEFDIHAAPREVGVLLVLLGMCALLAILRERFVEGRNLLDVATQFSGVGIMAVGMTMVIILGGIDLSIGSIVALSGCLATLAIHYGDCSLAVAVVVALAAGAGVGLVNGGLISGFRMAPFVITLGTMSMARSMAIVVTGAQQVTVTGCAAQEGLLAVAWSDTLWVPNAVWLMALTVLAGDVFLRFTRTGRHIYYIGANEEAARLSGLNITRIKWGVYAFCGVMAGLAGVVQASRVATGQPSAGMGDELRVIAAVIIGGASFTGGVGTVLGALLGAAIMGVLRQGLVVLGVDANWQPFVEGGVIIGAVALDMLRRRR